MSTSFAEAFKNIGIEAEDFSNNKEVIKYDENDKEIELLEKYYKMKERNASEKEIYNLVTDYGFLSEKHLSCYLQLNDEYHTKKEELEELRDALDHFQDCTRREYRELQNKYDSLFKKVQLLESEAKAAKIPEHYRLMLILTKNKDITPYGEDITKSKYSDSYKIYSTK